jgi:hypothetical protein
MTSIQFPENISSGSRRFYGLWCSIHLYQWPSLWLARPSSSAISFLAFTRVVCLQTFSSWCTQSLALSVAKLMPNLSHTLTPCFWQFGSQSLNPIHHICAVLSILAHASWYILTACSWMRCAPMWPTLPHCAFRCLSGPNQEYLRAVIHGAYLPHLIPSQLPIARVSRYRHASHASSMRSQLARVYALLWCDTRSRAMAKY